MEKTGDLFEIKEEKIFEWEIKDFFKSCEDAEKFYESLNFPFAGRYWVIKIYPNGVLDSKPDKYVSIFLIQKSTGPPVAVEFSLEIKNLKIYTEMEKRLFFGYGSDWGFPNFVLRSELLKKMSETQVLAITCYLKNLERNDVADSLFSRQLDICDNLRDIYVKSIKTDVKLNFKEKASIHAHRIILETRSPVFAAMLNHETKENYTGEVSIDDIERSTMDNLLRYIYSADVTNLTIESALPLYTAADKYDIKDVKKMCLDFIIHNLSAEWVCYIIEFAELYKEKKLSCHARQYFEENANEILESENWKTFSEKNHDLALDLLGSLVKILLPKTKK